MKQRKLKTKWMIITTTITFSTIFIFSLIIILFLSNALRHNELNEAESSYTDTLKLYESKQLNEITRLDLNRCLVNFQKVILFNKKGNKQIETKNDNARTYSPKFNPKNSKTATIKKRHNSDYLISTNRIGASHFQG